MLVSTLNKNAFWSTISLCFVLVMSCTFAEEGGSLKGTALFDGPPPEPILREITADKKSGCTCDKVLDESLVVDKASGGLKWVMVRILDVKTKDAPPKPAVPIQISQKGCTFTPHVIVVPPETDLEILNPDAILHNIHTTAYDFANPSQNTVHSPTEPKKIYKAMWLKEPEIIEIKCDIHFWMKGFIVVHDPRFCAVTGADGAFEIKNVPPGKYSVEVFHEKLGAKTLNVDIKAGAATDLGPIKFTPKK